MINFLRHGHLMKNNQYYFTPFLLAILLHVVVFVFIFFAFKVPTKLESAAIKNNAQPTPIVKAIAVNQADVEKEVSRLEQQQQQQAANRKAQQRKLYQQKKALKRQQQRAAKAERSLKSQTARLKKHQQQLAKQQAQLKQQQAKLKKQQAVREALLKKQKAEKALQAKVAAEQKVQAAARAKQVNNLINKYNILIRNAISPNWFVSSNQKQLSADLLISLAANGTVLNVSVAKSSGSAAFDSLAVAAVYKSSPLPVPKDPQAFAMFRQFNLKMLPQNISPGG